MTLREAMRDAAAGLRSGVVASGPISHSGTKGTIREGRVEKALSQFVPSRFSMVKGQAVNIGGTLSAEQDIMILDSISGKPIAEEHGVGIVPVETVCATLQVKSRLRPGEVGAAIDNVRSLKRIASLTYRSEQKVSGDQHLMWRPMVQKPWGAIVCLNYEGDIDSLRESFLRENTRETDSENWCNCLFVLDKAVCTFGADPVPTVQFWPPDATSILAIRQDGGEDLFMMFTVLLLDHLRQYVAPPVNWLAYMNSLGVRFRVESVPLKCGEVGESVQGAIRKEPPE